MRGVRKNAKWLALARLKRRYTRTRGTTFDQFPTEYRVDFHVDGQSFCITGQPLDDKKQADWFRNMLAIALWKVTEKENYDPERIKQTAKVEAIRSEPSGAAQANLETLQGITPRRTKRRKARVGKSKSATRKRLC